MAVNHPHKDKHPRTQASPVPESRSAGAATPDSKVRPAGAAVELDGDTYVEMIRRNSSQPGESGAASSEAPASRGAGADATDRSNEELGGQPDGRTYLREALHHKSSRPSEPGSASTGMAESHGAGTDVTDRSNDGPGGLAGPASADNGAPTASGDWSQPSEAMDSRGFSGWPPGAGISASPIPANPREHAPRKKRVDRSNIKELDQLKAEAAAEGNSTWKKSLGGGLVAKCEAEGPVSFYYRLTRGGDTERKLGDEHSMSLCEARAKASEWHSEMAAQQEKLRVGQLKARVRAIPKRKEKVPSGGPATLTSRSHSRIQDIRQFIRRGLSEGGRGNDVFELIYLLMLVPVGATELMAARFQDFDSSPVADRLPLQWIIKRGRAGRNGQVVGERIVYLSWEASAIVAQRCRNAGSADKHLFSGLSELPEAVWRGEVQRGLQSVGAWAGPAAGNEGFRRLFKEVACKHSYFVPALIEAALSQDPGQPGDDNHVSYVLQMHHLADWWSAILLHDADQFRASLMYTSGG